MQASRLSSGPLPSSCLGGAMTGSGLEREVIELLTFIAGAAFGSDVKAEVDEAPTAGTALQRLMAAVSVTVPRQVPVAVLVHEYDAAILSDVDDRQWADAREGVAALRSLTIATQAHSCADCIRHCIATGEVRFSSARTGGGVNPFTDGRIHSLASRMLSLSEGEARSTFPLKVARLGEHARQHAQGGHLAAAGMHAAAVAGATDADASMRLLHYWYGGNNFDSHDSHGKLSQLRLARPIQTVLTRTADSASFDSRGQFRQF